MKILEKNFTLTTRIISLMCLVAFGFVCLFGWFLIAQRKELYREKENALRQIVELAHGIVQQHARAAAGAGATATSIAEEKQRAIEAIRALRYNDSDYRRTTRPVIETMAEMGVGAEQVSSASSEIAEAAQRLSQGATSQAASLEESSASLEEIAAMTRSTADSAGRAAVTVATAEHLAGEAQQALQGMVQSMTAIEESSGRVAKIIRTIDEIAFQTNILALNAAVEAARAGEAGMGFAVVADEVRALAQRSAQAAKDTTTIIEESIAAAQDGFRRVDSVSQSINAVTETAVRVKELVDGIADASRQQSAGVDQVARAVADMEKVTQATAAAAEESAAASEELNAQASMTFHLVQRLATAVVGDSVVAAARASESDAPAMTGPRPVPHLPRTGRELLRANAR